MLTFRDPNINHENLYDSVSLVRRPAIVRSLDRPVIYSQVYFFLINLRLTCVLRNILIKVFVKLIATLNIMRLVYGVHRTVSAVQYRHDRPSPCVYTSLNLFVILKTKIVIRTPMLVAICIIMLQPVSTFYVFCRSDSMPNVLI